MSDLRAAVTGRNVEVAGWPTVSVVMPVRNEAAGLEGAVVSILTQEYPIPFDVCLAIGPSDDETVDIANALAADEHRLSIVDNPAGSTPAGLNAAIAASTGEIVVRVDGHSQLSPGYIRQAVETMIATGAVNIGGVQDAQGETPFERAVAASMKSWIGTGGARFHVGGQPGPVDTVYLGVFDRASGDKVGWFDEHLIRNQDYELNIRLRKAGGTIWFDPRLSVTYRPRASWAALAQQYYEYGYWKAEVLLIHPGSVKLRQFAPALFVSVLIGLLITGRWKHLFGTATIYAGGVTVASRPRTPSLVLVTMTQHLAWGSGVLSHLPLLGRKRRA